MPSLSDGSDQGIDERDRSMLASLGEGALNVESSVMVGVVHRDSRERGKAVSELAVVRRVPR